MITSINRTDEHITRVEVAKMINVTHQRVSQMKFMPKPVGKCKTTKIMLYDRTQTLKNLKARREKIEIKRQKMTTVVLNEAQPISFVAFMMGKFDHQIAKEKAKFKKYVSSITQPKTTVVQLVDPYFFTEKTHRNYK